MPDTPTLSVVRVMLTPLDANGLPQPHPPDYHAEITAEKLIVVAETASPELQRAGRDLRKKVEAILLSHHTKVHDDEQAKLKQYGIGRLDYPLESDVSDAILHEIVAASRGSILESHFARPDVQEVLMNELHHETRSQMQVHRHVHEVRHQRDKKAGA